MDTENLYWDKVWTSKDISLITLIILIIFALSISLAILLKTEPAYKSLIIDFGLFLSITTTFFIYTKSKKISLEKIGFGEMKVKWLFASIALAFGVIAIGGVLSSALSNLLNIESTGLQGIQAIASDKLWLNLLNFKLLVAILIPIAEELYFRGILFRFIRQNKSFIWSALASSLIFSSIHFSPSSIPFTFLLGFSSAFLFEKSKSIFPSFFLHIAVNNLVANLILFGLL